ncbi:MAG: hypothetical protein VB015_01780 [Erysipelotrichaceae bacterium]|nr:hypothetical protein [Erysipelotrichaceae bacterium]
MFTSWIENGSPTTLSVIVIIASSLVMGVLFGVIYCLLKRKDGFFKDMPITFAVFPVVVAIISMSTTAIFFAFGGTEEEARYGRVIVALLSAVIVLRFRSQQRTTEDLTYLFFLVGDSLLLGLGYVYLAYIFYAIVVALVIGLHLLHFPIVFTNDLSLKITIPEDLNYEEAFVEVFNSLTASTKLVKVKTADLGSIFVLDYEVTMKKGTSQKELIDKIREINGNLNVVLTSRKFGIEN